MDKNTITGFILIALVVIGFSWYSQPSSEELKAMAQRDSIAAVEQQKQAEAEQEKIDTILQNIERYDGTSIGQKDVPRG